MTLLVNGDRLLQFMFYCGAEFGKNPNGIQTADLNWIAFLLNRIIIIVRMDKRCDFRNETLPNYCQ